MRERTGAWTAGARTEGSLFLERRAEMELTKRFVNHFRLLRNRQATFANQKALRSSQSSTVATGYGMGQHAQLLISSQPAVDSTGDADGHFGRDVTRSNGAINAWADRTLYLRLAY